MTIDKFTVSEVSRKKETSNIPFQWHKTMETIESEVYETPHTSIITKEVDPNNYIYLSCTQEKALEMIQDMSTTPEKLVYHERIDGMDQPHKIFLDIDVSDPDTCQLGDSAWFLKDVVTKFYCVMFIQFLREIFKLDVKMEDLIVFTSCGMKHGKLIYSVHIICKYLFIKEPSQYKNFIKRFITQLLIWYEFRTYDKFLYDHFICRYESTKGIKIPFIDVKNFGSMRMPFSTKKENYRPLLHYDHINHKVSKTLFDIELFKSGMLFYQPSKFNIIDYTAIGAISKKYDEFVDKNAGKDFYGNPLYPNPLYPKTNKQIFIGERPKAKKMTESETIGIKSKVIKSIIWLYREHFESFQIDKFNFNGSGVVSFKKAESFIYVTVKMLPCLIKNCRSFGVRHKTYTSSHFIFWFEHDLFWPLCFSENCKIASKGARRYKVVN